MSFSKGQGECSHRADQGPAIRPWSASIKVLRPYFNDIAIKAGLRYGLSALCVQLHICCRPSFVTIFAHRLLGYILNLPAGSHAVYYRPSNPSNNQSYFRKSRICQPKDSSIPLHLFGSIRSALSQFPPALLPLISVLS